MIGNFKGFPYLRTLDIDELASLRPVNDHLVTRLREKRAVEQSKSQKVPTLPAVPNLREAKEAVARRVLEEKSKIKEPLFRLPDPSTAQQALMNKGYVSLNTPYDAPREAERQRREKSKAAFVGGAFKSAGSGEEAKQRVSNRAYMATGLSEEEIRANLAATKAAALAAREKERWRARVEAHRIRCVQELDGRAPGSHRHLSPRSAADDNGDELSNFSRQGTERGETRGTAATAATAT